MLDLLDRFNLATKLCAVKFCVDVDLNVLTKLVVFFVGVSDKLYRLALFDLDEVWLLLIILYFSLALFFLISLLLL